MSSEHSFEPLMPPVFSADNTRSTGVISGVPALRCLNAATILGSSGPSAALENACLYRR